MEFTDILSFIGLFILILSVLIGLVYYGIKEPTYEETQTVKTENKKPVKKVKRDESKAKKVEKKKQKNSGSSEESAQEEEPIVIIPDPFTNKVSSRFAGAGKKVEVEKKEPVIKPVKSEPKPEIKQENKTEKVKPQATVKPSQVVEEKKQPIEPVQKVEPVQKIEPVQKVEPVKVVVKSNELEVLNSKVKDLNKALNEKLESIAQLNKQNMDLKTKLESSLKSSKKYQTDFETQQQTNQVIQKELTRLTTLVSSMEKEKQTILHEVAVLRNQQPVESNDALVHRIDQLNKELNDRVTILSQIQNQNQTLEVKINEMNDRNAILFNQLQTQEALTKQLELKLEMTVSMDKYKQKETELNTIQTDLKCLRAENEQKESEVMTLRTRADNLNNEVQDLKTENSSLKTQIDEWKNGSDQNKESSQTRIGELEQEIKQLKDIESQLSVKQKQLDESFAHVQHLNGVIGDKDAALGDKQRQLDESFNHVQHLNHVIGQKDGSLSEKQRQLDESFAHVQHLNGVIEGKDSRLGDLERQVNELKSENENLRQKVQALEANRVNELDELNSKIKQLSEENELIKVKNTTLKTTLEETEKSLNKLDILIQLESKNQIKSNGVKESNGHNRTDEINSQLEQLQIENENLKKLLEEEIKSSKASLSDRARIRDLIKIGQDALEHEKSELRERLDNKINGSNGH